MPLSGSISKSLILSVVLFIGLPLFATLQSGQEMPPTDLNGWMQNGEKILRATRWDPAELLETARALANGSSLGAENAKVATALLLSARLYAKAEKFSECVTSCMQLLDTFPQEAAATEACELAGTVMSDRLDKALEAAELYEKRALAFPQEMRAEWFLEKAFTLYEEQGAWDRAVDCAQSFLDYYADRPSAANMKLQLADIWLAQGKVNLAEQNLVEFVQDYGDDPWTVVARQTLAEIYDSQDKLEKANEQRSRAWSCYQQHMRAGDKMTKEVRHAAAQAFFDLQISERVDFHQTCEFTPNTVSEKEAESSAKALVEDYNRIMLTDADFAVSALIAQAEVYEELGNFLLQQGYIRFASSTKREDRPPHESAMGEYLRAIALYERAWDHSRLQKETPELARLTEQAATRAVELRLGNGDLVFGWALQLQQTLPPGLGSSKELEKRFEGLSTTVYPVLESGLTLYTAAQAMAMKMGVPRLAERAQSGLAVPFEPFAKELFAVNQMAWDAVTTAASQIAGSVEMSEHAATAMPQLEQLETTQKQATTLAQRTTERSREILMAMWDAHASPASRTIWENHTVGFYNDYASFCRNIATDLNKAISRLNGNKSNKSEKLQIRLRSVSRDLANQEYRKLEEAYELCVELAITNPVSDKIIARLVALNPKEYRDKAETHFGTRQKP